MAAPTRRCVLSLASQPAKHEPQVLIQCARENRAVEELLRVAIIERRLAGNDLFQSTQTRRG
jgi:hypothetical protein